MGLHSIFGSVASDDHLCTYVGQPVPAIHSIAKLLGKPYCLSAVRLLLLRST